MTDQGEQAVDPLPERPEDRAPNAALHALGALDVIPYVSGGTWRIELDERLLRAAADAAYQAGREDEARAGVTVNADDLRIVLDQRVQHSHMRPGIWDDSNRPEIAGRPCVECAARGRLRAALDVAEKG